MNLLVDTCTFLWLAFDDPNLSVAARSACRDRSNRVYASALSAWEIAIKHRLGRLTLPEPPVTWFSSRRQAMDLSPLAFDEDSAGRVGLLPGHHRDPFDRGLVAQAIGHRLTIVTPDSIVARYPAPVLW